MADSWARAVMELVLHVNKDQAQRDIGTIDGATPGRKVGQQFGQAFSREQLTRMTDGMTKFAAASARQAADAGSNAGSGFGRNFTDRLGPALAGAARKIYQQVNGRPGTPEGIAGLRDRTADLAKSLGSMQAGVKDAGARASMIRLQLQADALGRKLQNENVDITGQPEALAKLLTLEAAADRLKSKLRTGPDLGSLTGHRQLLASLGGAIGPGILGLGLRATGILGLGGAALGAVPALAGAAAPLALAGVGAGATAAFGAQVAAPAMDLVQAQTKATAAAGAATNATQRAAAARQQQAVNQQAAALDPAQRSMFRTITALQDMWQKFTTSFAPMFAQALAPLPRLFASVLPALRQFFSGALTMAQPLMTGLAQLARAALPLLGQAFRATAPLLGPLLGGLTQLLRGLLPGLIALLRAAGPAVQVFGQFLGQLGTGLGGMLSTFAQVMGPSSQILRALLGIVTSLLPVLGQLAAIFARALAPVFSQFAGIVVSLMPFIATLGQLLASLAGAILGDLVAAFGAAAQLLRTIAPALNAFAKAISSVFTILENSGVFAILGDAIEAIAKPLGQLINALLRGLTPIIPPILGLVTRLAAILTAGLARAIAALLPPLTRLVTVALAALAQTLPIIIPTLTILTQILTAVFVRVVTDLAIAFNALLTAIPPRLLSSIALGIMAIWAAMRVGGLIMAVSNPIGLITLAAAALVIGITELATHWHQVWGAIETAARATGAFFDRLWRNQVVQDILAVWSLGLIPLARHWTQVWGAITDTAVAAWHATYSNALAPLINWFTVSLPHGLDVANNHVHQWWSDVANAFSAGYHAVYNNTVAPFIRIFTTELPAAFQTAVQAISRWWSNLYNSIRGPVARVVDSVLNGLINVFDWITSHIGLGRPIANVHPFGLAAGGRIPGYGGGDRRPALLEDGETVVSKEHSRLPFMEAAFRTAGVPGYQAGGIVMPPTAQRPGTPTISPTQGATDRIGQAAPGIVAHLVTTVLGKVVDLAKITAALATGNTTALANAFGALTGHRPPGLGGGSLMDILLKMPRELVSDAVKWLMGNAGGASGSAIVNYAMRWIGHIPYVWGGVQVPGGADCCLPGDQPVLTSTGPKPIIDVAAGDWVITWDGGVQAVRRVTRRSAPRHQQTWLVITATTELEASGNHPFLTARPGGWEWTQTDDLRLGDLVVRHDEQAGDFREEPVVSVEPRGVKDTYDITVDGTHCFVAGGLVVHNSGFVQAVYHHFGINAPRTSEAQGAWVQRSGAVPGGLAFYHSPPGGADPGHVGIVRNALQVISQGGGMGPQLMGLHDMPLLWTGVPPGGLHAGGALGITPTGSLQNYARRLVDARWGDAYWTYFADIVHRESNWDVTATNPASGAYGIPQALPGSKMASAGADWRTNGYTQLRWMVDYLSSRWTNPLNADINEMQNHWYGRGGWINEPVTGVGRWSRALYHFAEGGQRELVTPEDQVNSGGTTGLAARLDRVIALLDAAPARTAAGMARAVTVPAGLQAHAARISAR